MLRAARRTPPARRRLRDTSGCASTVSQPHGMRIDGLEVATAATGGSPPSAERCPVLVRSPSAQAHRAGRAGDTIGRSRPPWTCRRNGRSRVAWRARCAPECACTSAASAARSPSPPAIALAVGLALGDGPTSARGTAPQPADRQQQRTPQLRAAEGAAGAEASRRARATAWLFADAQGRTGTVHREARHQTPLDTPPSITARASRRRTARCTNENTLLKDVVVARADIGYDVILEAPCLYQLDICRGIRLDNYQICAQNGGRATNRTPTRIIFRPCRWRYLTV